ncbi:MAG: hypothetical protein ACD_47C00221G0003 [uncultured bacterium]|nr:MAG: hypothetical protein ACD_47C00221G0003 [uncultured bacterium]
MAICIISADIMHAAGTMKTKMAITADGDIEKLTILASREADAIFCITKNPCVAVSEILARFIRMENIVRQNTARNFPNIMSNAPRGASRRVSSVPRSFSMAVTSIAG